VPFGETSDRRGSNDRSTGDEGGEGYSRRALFPFRFYSSSLFRASRESLHYVHYVSLCLFFVFFSFFFVFFCFFFFLFFFFSPVLIPFRIRVMPFHRVIVEIVHAYCRIARECRPIDQLLNRLSHTTSTDSPPRFIISGRGGERRGGRILLRLHCYYYY
jgi:hypothetical protein